jgi:iron complex transport system ATP-binding protein
MIRFEGVTARYRRASRDAVSDVSLEAPRGAVTAVVGPNGSGKSTLVRVLLGRVAPGAGRASIDGDDVRSMERRRFAQRVAVVTQREEPVFPLAVEDYVALGRRPHVGRWGTRSGADRGAIARAIADAGVEPLVGRETDQLSGGEWQRVRLARALAQDTEAIVLDEPSTYLDIAHEMETFELVDALARRGRAVLLVSHQLNLVARFATTVVLLHRGAVVASGTPADVMQGPVLEQVYEWPLVIARDPAVGAPALIPLRRQRASRSD